MEVNLLYDPKSLFEFKDLISFALSIFAAELAILAIYPTLFGLLNDTNFSKTADKVQAQVDAKKVSDCNRNAIFFSISLIAFAAIFNFLNIPCRSEIVHCAFAIKIIHICRFVFLLSKYRLTN